MTSLRRRLLVGTVLATVAIYLVAAAVLYVSIRRSLVAEFDATLEAKARALVAQTEQGEKGVKIDLEPGQLTGGGGLRAEGFVLLKGDGSVMARSEGPAHEPWWVSADAKGVDETFNWGVLASGPRIRSVSLRFVPRPEDDEHPVMPRETLTLVVARDPAALLARLTQLAWLLASVFGLTVLASAGIMAWVVGRGLRPLGRLAQRISQLDEEDLSDQVSVSDSPSEMQPVVDRLNDLLRRLKVSFSRERAFTADVAHELRTPLAGLTTALEVCGLKRRAPEEYEMAIGKCLAVSRSMRSMVDNLLTLARADARQHTLSVEPLDLGALAQEAWQAFDSQARERRLRVEWHLAPTTLVRADRSLLLIVLQNLFDNAVSYANEGGIIRIDVNSDGDAVKIRIANSGSQIATEDGPKVFDRFWRGDTARTQTGQHCGLGLALCQRITTLLGGEIHAETMAGGTFGITLSLPPRAL